MACELAHHPSAGLGTERPVVFLGALGSDKSMWDATVASLNDGRIATLAVDLRGHGESPVPAGPYSIADLADDVLATLDRLHLPVVDLVGISLGGAVAQHIAITAPQRLASLSLISTTWRFGTREAWLDRAASVRVTGTAALVGGLAGRWVTFAYAQQHPEILDRLEDMVRRTDREGYAACAEALAEWDSSACLGEISAPTLVLGGVDDQSTNPDTLAVLANKIPDARHVIVEPGAHLIPVERPEVVSSLIAEHVMTHR